MTVAESDPVIQGFLQEELHRCLNVLEALQKKLAQFPKGALNAREKLVAGRTYSYHYLVYREGGRVVNRHVPKTELTALSARLKERDKCRKEIATYLRRIAYLERLLGARRPLRVHEPPASYGLPGGEIVLYTAPDGTVSLDVCLERETVWLSQKQMALLFDTERSVITKHLGNIFRSGELERESNVQKMHIGGSDRPVSFFSLDAALSVGYRVNSKRGTQFRIWATKVLRDHILKGFTANERRLKELNQAVRLVASLADRRDLTGDEASALLRVVGEYSFALDLLDDYDHQRVSTPKSRSRKVRAISHDEALRLVAHMRDRFGGSALFGREKDRGLESALGAVVQTFDGKDLYPSLEAKAANLLYFLVKNHAFVDGNKRIGAALFLWFLEKNGALQDAQGQRRISQAALVALTLLIAESRPAERETIVRIATHLLAKHPGDQGN